MKIEITVTVRDGGWNWDHAHTVDKSVELEIHDPEIASDIPWANLCAGLAELAIASYKAKLADKEG